MVRRYLCLFSKNITQSRRLGSDIEIMAADVRITIFKKVFKTRMVWYTYLGGWRINMIDVLHNWILDRLSLSVKKLAHHGTSVVPTFLCIIRGKERYSVFATVIKRKHDRCSSRGWYVLWARYARLRHPSGEGLKRTQHFTNGIPAVKHIVITLCGVCMQANSNRVAVKRAYKDITCN